MDIPPLLKISTNLLNKIRPSSGSLLRTNNSSFIESTGAKISESDSNNGNIISPTSSLKSLEHLLNLNLEDSVKYIHTFLVNSNFDFKECLITNLNLLSNNYLEHRNLKSKDIEIIKSRILSFDDHLNVSQISKLIFSLTNSDRRLFSLVSYLFKLFLDRSKDHSSLLLNIDNLYSYFLVLSSLNIYKRNVIDDKRKLISNGFDKSNLSDVESFNTEIPQIEVKLLCKLEDILSKQKFNIDNEDSLIFLKTISHTSSGNDNLVRSLLSYLDIEEMSVEQMCNTLHTYSLLPISLKEFSGSESLIESILDKVTDGVKNGHELETNCFPQLYHFFYITGNLEHELFYMMSDTLANNNMEFNNSQDFYRVAFPLAISNMVSSPELSKWMLTELATKCDNYIKEVSNFLFVLMSVSNSVKLESKTTTASGDNKLLKTDVETDIYEKALMYLNESEKGTYFPSERSALLYLFDRAMELVEVCDDDQFVQLVQAMTNKLVKRNTSMKLKLLHECKNRVNSVGMGGILHIMQFGVWAHGNRNPDLVTLLTTYMERILSDISTFNNGDHSLLQMSGLYTESFVNDSKTLANVLYLLDWSNIYSPDLGSEVSKLISNGNYEMVVGAELRDLSHIVHYIAMCNSGSDVLDPLYIIIGEVLRNCCDIHPRDLIMVLESMVVNSSHTRHRNLLNEIEKKALSVSGSISTIETLSKTLTKVTDVEYSFKDNGNKSFVIEINT